MSTITTANPETGTPDSQRAPLWRRPGITLGLALLIGIGVLRIVSTYHVFNHTIDEGAHLACGIQWFQGGYDYDPKHTPVSRISIALLPYLAGVRGYGNASFWEEGVLVLSSGGHYWRNLTLARIGVLPYFVWAMVVIFLWVRRIYGPGTALIAAGIFSTLPVILAHSGLATTDIPLTACFITAVYAFTWWLEAPNWRTTVGFGLATGLAVATKLSTVAFLPMTVIGTLPFFFSGRKLTQAATAQGEGTSEQRWGLGSFRSGLRSGVVFAVCAFMVVWAVYRFSYAPINQFSSGPDHVAAKVFGRSSSAARAVRFLTARVPLPAPELYNGFRDLRNTNRLRPLSYMFGQVKQGGWWYFYPVSIGLKTPLGVLALGAIGALWLGLNWFRTRADWRPVVPIVGFLAPILMAAPASLDIGVRHVMPVFAFLSMLAAVGVVKLWDYSATSGAGGKGWSLAGRMAAVVLLAWAIVSSARSHPDYLSYFNELGGSHPENLLLISDFDWGQDMARLATYLHEQRVEHVSIAYDGFFDPNPLGFPDMEYITCDTTPSGWIAIEERRARLYRECYPWLDQQKLVARVGKTMLIYYVTPLNNTNRTPVLPEKSALPSRASDNGERFSPGLRAALQSPPNPY